MSPRAAWRLESLGFEQVYDYVPGKADWAAAGLPLEGTKAQVPRVGGLARTDVPRARLDERVGEVRARAEDAGWDTAIVLNEKGVVLGRLYRTQLEGDPEARVEQAMKSGPSTFRPDVAAAEMLEFMRRHDLETAPVTSSDGRLVGLLLREDAERAGSKG